MHGKKNWVLSMQYTSTVQGALSTVFDSFTYIFGECAWLGH